MPERQKQPDGLAQTLIPTPPGFPSKPENSFARNPSIRKKRTVVCLIIYVLLAVEILVLLLTVAWLAVYCTAGPRGPTFSIVQAFVKKPQSDLKPEFEFALNAESHDRMGVKTLVDRGTNVSLLHKEKKIAAGDLPPFNQMGKNTTVNVDLFLSTFDDLPNEIKDIIVDLSSNSSVSLVLSTHVPVQVDVFKTVQVPMKMNILCNFTVTLGQESHIVSQHYVRKLKLDRWF